MLTCAPRCPVRFHQFFERAVEGYSCSWYTVVVALRMRCQTQTTNDFEMNTLLLLHRYLLCHTELTMPARLLGRVVRREKNEGGAERGSRGSSAAENFRSAPAIRYSMILRRSLNLRDRVFYGCNCPDHASSSSY